MANSILDDIEKECAVKQLECIDRHRLALYHLHAAAATKDRRKNLVQAAAQIVLEIARLDRVAAAKTAYAGSSIERKQRATVRALKAIADGAAYEFGGSYGSFLIVKNPDYTPDNGENPNLVVELSTGVHPFL